MDEKKMREEILTALAAKGIALRPVEPAFLWEDFKKNGDGMVPVIVQDAEDGAVLMLAYMDEAAYLLTMETGLMTYFSRSRRELWLKGLTSGHFQYLTRMLIDCDNDTLLAQVIQTGAACHTGNRSCFYRELGAAGA